MKSYLRFGSSYRKIYNMVSLVRKSSFFRFTSKGRIFGVYIVSTDKDRLKVTKNYVDSIRLKVILLESFKWAIWESDGDKVV